MTVNGAIAFINYGEMGHHLALVHTEVDPSHSGKGVGSALVEKTLMWIDQQHLTMMPFCPFIYEYVNKHPEWNRIVNPKFMEYVTL